MGRSEMPEIRYVATPHSLDELCELMATAHQRGLVVVPRGSGTKLGWLDLPPVIDVLLDLSAFNSCRFNPDTGEVKVGAGASVAAVQAELARHGRRAPLDPPSPWATVGGALVTAETGPLAHLFGPPAAHVVDATIALPDGTVSTVAETVQLLGNCVCDLRWAYPGHPNHASVVAEIVLRTQALPETQAWVICPIAQPAHVADLLEQIAESGVTPAAIELDMPGLHAPATPALTPGESPIPRPVNVTRLPADRLRASGAAQPGVTAANTDRLGAPGSRPSAPSQNDPGAGGRAPLVASQLPRCMADEPGAEADGALRARGGRYATAAGGTRLSGEVGAASLTSREVLADAARRSRAAAADAGPGELPQRRRGPVGSVGILIEGSAASVGSRIEQLAGRLGPTFQVTERMPQWWGRYPFRADEVALRINAPEGQLHMICYALSDAAGIPIPVRGSLGGGSGWAALPGELPARRLMTILDTVREVLLARGGSAVVQAVPSELREVLTPYRRP